MACSDDDVAAEALTAMRGSAIGGLFACGLDTPFTAIYERQERCVAQARAAGVPWLPCIVPTLPTYSSRYQMAVQLAIVLYRDCSLVWLIFHGHGV